MLSSGRRLGSHGRRWLRRTQCTTRQHHIVALVIQEQGSFAVGGTVVTAPADRGVLGEQSA